MKKIYKRLVICFIGDTRSTRVIQVASVGGPAIFLFFYYGFLVINRSLEDFNPESVIRSIEYVHDLWPNMRGRISNEAYDIVGRKLELLKGLCVEENWQKLGVCRRLETELLVSFSDADWGDLREVDYNVHRLNSALDGFLKCINEGVK